MNEMVTNRSSSDAKYNYTDLNRVEAATAEIAALLTAQGYVTTVISKTDWVRTKYPTRTEMERYLGNVKKCVQQFAAVPGVELPESMNNLTYIGANNIEKVLEGIEAMIEQMKAAYIYCGTINCGGDRLI